jgi:hypothetical protein
MICRGDIILIVTEKKLHRNSERSKYKTENKKKGERNENNWNY